MPVTQEIKDYIVKLRNDGVTHREVAKAVNKKWPGTNMTDKYSGTVIYQQKKQSIAPATGNSSSPSSGSSPAHQNMSSKLGEYAYVPRQNQNETSGNTGRKPAVRDGMTSNNNGRKSAIWEGMTTDNGEGSSKTSENNGRKSVIWEVVTSDNGESSSRTPIVPRGVKRIRSLSDRMEGYEYLEEGSSIAKKQKVSKNVEAVENAARKMSLDENYDDEDEDEEDIKFISTRSQKLKAAAQQPQLFSSPAREPSHFQEIESDSEIFSQPSRPSRAAAMVMGNIDMAASATTPPSSAQRKGKAKSKSYEVEIFVGPDMQRFTMDSDALIRRSKHFQIHLIPDKKCGPFLFEPYIAEDFKIVHRWVTQNNTRVVSRAENVEQARKLILSGIRAHRIAIDLGFIHLCDSITTDLLGAYKKFDIWPSKLEAETLWLYKTECNKLRQFMLRCMVWNHFTTPEDKADEDGQGKFGVAVVGDANNMTSEDINGMFYDKDFARGFLAIIRNCMPNGKGHVKNPKEFLSCTFHDDHAEGKNHLCWLSTAEQESGSR